MMDVLIRQLWARRWVLGIAAVSFAVLAAIVSSLMTKTYRASVVVSPRDYSEGFSGLRSDSAVAGLAALAGVSVSGGAQTDEYFAFLNSKGFKLRFIEAQTLTRVFSSEGSSIERAAATSDSSDRMISAQDAMRKLDSTVLGISRDKATGLITVTIDWSDPQLAAKWAEAYIGQANSELASRALEETDRKIAYLREQATNASQIEVRQAVYRLLESQLKSRMLATIGAEFAFKTIDPAIVADLDKPIRPRRVPMIVGGGLAGGLLAAFGILVAAGVSGAARPGSIPATDDQSRPS